MKHVEQNAFRLHNSLFIVQCSGAKTMIIMIIRCICGYNVGTNFSKCKFSCQNIKQATCFNLLELYLE